MIKASDRQNKAEQTTAAAWEIINAEANARDQKTAKLRQVRLEKEAAQAAVAAETAKAGQKPRKRKPSGS